MAWRAPAYSGRGEAMQLSDLTAADGSRHPWDFDLGRSELGAGYRVTRYAVVKLVGQRNAFLDEGKRDLEAHGARTHFDLIAAQNAIGF